MHAFVYDVVSLFDVFPRRCLRGVVASVKLREAPRRSATLRNTRGSSSRGKTTVSAKLRDSPQNFRKRRAEEMLKLPARKIVLSQPCPGQSCTRAPRTSTVTCGINRYRYRYRYELYICIDIYIYIYIYTHTHIYTYIHTHIAVLLLLLISCSLCYSLD